VSLFLLLISIIVKQRKTLSLLFKKVKLIKYKAQQINCQIVSWTIPFSFVISNIKTWGNGNES
jgi:hypothetical protein